MLHSNSFSNNCSFYLSVHGVTRGASIAGIPSSWSSRTAPKFPSLSGVWTPPIPCFPALSANCLAKFLALAARASCLALSTASLPAYILASFSFLALSAAFLLLSNSSASLHHLSFSLSLSLSKFLLAVAWAYDSMALSVTGSLHSLWDNCISLTITVTHLACVIHI